MKLSIALLAPALAVALSGAAQAQMIAPKPYLSFADSPFASDPTTVLENFEDGALNVPGVTASASWFVSSPSVQSDSVDGDDGLVNGITTSGYAFYSASSQSSVTFTFDSQVLGALPTKAGLVWTDVGNVTSGSSGFGEVTFTARDGNGNVIGTIGPTSVGDGTANGAAAEDRFFGVVHAGGIRSITMTASNSVDWEVDHLQYAALVPEPETMMLFAAGGLLLATRIARRGGRNLA